MSEKNNENEEVTSDNVTKVRTKSLAPEPEIYKVDLSAPPPEVAQEPVPEKIDENQTNLEEVIAEVEQEEVTNEQVPTLEEITNEETAPEETASKETVEELFPGIEPRETSMDLPDNIQKLMTFMDDTGGDLNDYVKLNRDTESLDNQDVLLEYYQSTKPHLSNDEVNFLIEDQFSYDESLDDEIVIKRKKVAQKEQVASAKAYLDGQKSKYYEEIKAGSKLTEEQQKAVNFYHQYTKESKENQASVLKQKAHFTQETNQVFNDKFKGFDFSVGDKKFRYNVKDVDGTKETQSDINNFVGKFLDGSDSLSNARGYHKSLFTAMNPDAVAQHFYEQGKADALKDSVARAKNINTTPRQSHGEVSTGGVTYKVLGSDSNDFKFKIKNKR